MMTLQDVAFGGGREVESLHPEVTQDRRDEWALMAATASGESAVKTAGEKYLPKPSGYKAQQDGGKAMYAAYRGRAQFPEILTPSVSAMIGIIHGREIKIEMPDAMQSALWENADGDGMPLEVFHRNITRNLLTYGRFGVLADVPLAGGDPYLRGYAASAITNWDRDWCVLDETAMARDGFKWKTVKRYRELYLDGGAYAQRLWTANEKGEYASEEIAVVARGGAALTDVPFVVANAHDVSATILTPPLIGVARSALAIYQLSADYRHQLYMSGQETLVALNGPAPTAVGAGVVHAMQGDGISQPDLKYVSPSCSGIDAHLKAMEDNRIAAITAGARLLEQSDKVQESGEARRLRFASETATLSSIAMVSCALLERSLRHAGAFMGLPPDGIIVTPPENLMDQTISAAEFAALFGVYTQGGMSWPTLHAIGQKGGIFSADVDADAEYARINPVTDNLDQNAA